MMNRLIVVTLIAAVGLASSAAEKPAPGISGKIALKGEAPPRKKLSTALDEHCAKHTAPLSEDYVVGSGGELANVMVWVKEGLEEGREYPAPAEPVKVTQEGCVYKPHVIGVMVGQALSVDNGDDTLHNVHGLPKTNSEFNVVQRQKGASNSFVFKSTAEQFLLKCDVHPWMKAWIYVFPHPFFGVSQADGTFKLPALPPGEYVIAARHEKAGVQEQKLTIEAGKPATLDFTFEPRKRN